MSEPFNPKTIRELFNGSLFSIPNYQRPYSWEDKNFKDFCNDIQKALESHNPQYYLGHFILSHKEGDRYPIIDGQQRITTLMIFMRALKQFIPLADIQSNYLAKTQSQSILVAESLSQDFINNFIKDPENKTIYKSKAEKKVEEAYNTFKTFLKDFAEDDKKLQSIFNLLQNSQISITLIKNIQIGNQIFIYHNDRGKDLSKLELLKSYFCNQVYKIIKDTKEANHFIDNKINTTFSRIYKYLDDVNFPVSEDNALNYYHLIFEYKNERKKTNTEPFDFKTFCTDFDKELNLIDSSSEKQDFIIKTLDNMKDTYRYVLAIGANKNHFKIANILALSEDQYTYSVLVALYFTCPSGDPLNNKELSEFFYLLKTLAFHRQFYSGYSNYLDKVARKIYRQEYNKAQINLKGFINNGFNWGKGHLQEAVDKFLDPQTFNYFYQKGELSKYILWKYENQLRKKPPYFIMDNFKGRGGNDVNFQTLDHIYAQKYEEKLQNKESLHDIGNLMPVSKSVNSEQKDNLPEKKLGLNHIVDNMCYPNLAMVNDIRIKYKKWDDETIKQRGTEIKTFIKEFINPNGKYWKSDF